jgi:hypothetical protein
LLLGKSKTHQIGVVLKTFGVHVIAVSIDLLVARDILIVLV